MNAYIYDAVRTPRGRGKNNGALYEVKPIDLLANLLNGLAQRTDLDTALVDDVVMGCVTPIGEQGGNIAKAAALYAGWNTEVAGFQLNRFCASGLEAVNLAAMKVASGMDDIVVAGGIECMSRVAMGSDGGAMMYHPSVAARVGFVPQGIGADLIATLEGFTRSDVDAYALQSQQRAFIAQTNGHFDRSVLPVCDASGLIILQKDEYLRPETTAASLAKLQPAFAAIGELGFDTVAQLKYPQVERINYMHHAGNSSGIVDGAAAVLIANKEKGDALGWQPRARILAVAATGSEPTIMLTGPTPAALKALRKANMQVADIDLWEMNEAFAAAVLKFQKDLGIDNDKLNVSGGAIALGHPLGATGAMLLGTVLDELERRDLRTALITLCVGGGMGVATIIERV